MPENEIAKRRRERENLKSAIPGAAPAVYRAALHKAGRTGRLYRIDPVPGGWRCEVYFGAAIHRTRVVFTRTHMLEDQRQYDREVHELILDGWTLDV